MMQETFRKKNTFVLFTSDASLGHFFSQIKIHYIAYKQTKLRDYSVFGALMVYKNKDL